MASSVVPFFRMNSPLALCRVCGDQGGAHDRNTPHKFIPATLEEDEARRLIQNSTLHHNYHYRKSAVSGEYSVFGPNGYFAATWVDAADRLFPTAGPRCS